jgi:UDP-N-acetylglucosamine diphosphorylase/glucosamine-1-phosphate N-acetyltransferase
MDIIIFDDARRADFFPLTLTRSTSDLRVGILKLRQRLMAMLNTDECNLIVDAELQELYRQRHPGWDVNTLPDGDVLLVNSRLRLDDDLVTQLQALQSGCLLVCGDVVIAARMQITAQQITAEQLPQLLASCTEEEIDAHLWCYPWELIAANSAMLEADFQAWFYDKDNFFETELGVTILNPYNVWIGEGAHLMPGVIIDASQGPVVIDEGAVVMHHAVIIGPAYVGKKSRIKVGAKIYEGTSIGPVCKVGGEVEETIIQAYSNKQHDGFLGHSYLGEWVNLGADTNNSDLKNTYKAVAMYSYSAGTSVSTGQTFVGCLIGDHAKTGINSTINTGAVIGVGCNLFGRELISGFIPDFSWGSAAMLSEYRFDAWADTADKVKQRRGLALGDEEKDLYTKIAARKMA